MYRQKLLLDGEKEETALSLSPPPPHHNPHTNINLKKKKSKYITPTKYISRSIRKTKIPTVFWYYHNNKHLLD